MAASFFFDPGLTLNKPIKGFIQIVLIGICDIELISQRARMPQPRRCQLRGRRNNPFRDHSKDQVTLSTSLRRDELIQAEVADRSQYGFHMAVRQRPLDNKRLFRTEQFITLKDPAQGLDTGFRPVGNVCNGPFANLGPLSPPFTKKDSRGGIAIGNFGLTY